MPQENLAEQSEELNNDDQTVIEGELDTTGEAATDVDPAAESNDDLGEEPEHKQSRSQNAKQRLRRKNREQQEVISRQAEENKKLRKDFSALESKVDSVINPAPERPQRVDYDTEEEYEDALYDFRNHKPSAPAAESSAAPAADTATDTDTEAYAPDDVRENWLDQVDDANDKYEDFAAKLESIPPKSMTDSMTRAIMESGNGAEIAYFLGSNHAEAARIAKLGFVKQVIEIDKLGDKFKTTTSSAPAPIDPAKPGDTSEKDVSKMSGDEYRRHRQEQKRARKK